MRIEKIIFFEAWFWFWSRNKISFYLEITANPRSLLPPPCARRSDNEHGKWKRAVLISRPCSTMNESFIIPVPWFAEYRVNVTTDLWVKNGNGRPMAKNHGGGTVHAMRACNYRSVPFFPAVSYSGSRRSRAGQATRRGGGPSPRLEKVTNNPGRGGGIVLARESCKKRIARISRFTCTPRV